MSKQNKTKIKQSSDSESNSDSNSEPSSESESNKKIKQHTDPANSSQKKRGRPKKTIVPKQSQKISLPIKEKEPEEEQLILRIPVYDDEDNSSEKNMFTMKDDSDCDETFQKESTKLINSLTETENNSECSDEYDVKTLLLELKKKDQIIKKLKTQLTTQKPVQNNEQSLLFTKEANKKLINLKLFDINNEEKPIIVDKTNVACHWCSYNFDTMPCFIPDRYTNGKFYVFGCFCTYSCAMKYNNSLGDYRVTTRNSLMKDLCNTIFGSDEMLTEAPEKEALQKFGGPMSIEEFRNHNLLCKKEFKIKIPPLIPLMSILEENFKDPSMNPKGFNKFKC